MDDTTIHDHDDSEADDTITAHYSGLERQELQALLKAPHGCVDGLVFIGHMVEDEETGEEVESFESVPCRRCADFGG
jgi:hypothetical protein